VRREAPTIQAIYDVEIIDVRNKAAVLKSIEESVVEAGNVTILSKPPQKPEHDHESRQEIVSWLARMVSGVET
jgi:hypothetical protein